jgi:hypothetical protein
MNNIYQITGDLTSIQLKHYVPQVGSCRYDISVENNKIIFNDININDLINTKIDFVVDENYNLLLGSGHFKLNKKQQQLKMAGGIMINADGKITYIDNDSGHYEPNTKRFIHFMNKIMPILSNDFNFLLKIY